MICAQTNTFPISGSVGIGTTNPTKSLEVKGDVGVGSLGARQYLKVSSSQWPELRFQTPSSDEQIRLGVAHANDSFYGVNEGDFYVYSGAVNEMPFIARKGGDVILGLKGGNVGIGTTSPGSYRLAVNGDVRAKKVVVEGGWSDFVFELGYDLPTLSEVEAHIAAKGHLKDIPSAAEVAEHGISLGEMDAKLLQKIEELMLYTIEQEKRIRGLEARLVELGATKDEQLNNE